MGFGSWVKDTVKSVTKEIKRSARKTYDQAVRSVNDYANIQTQLVTGGMVGVDPGFKVTHGEVRENWDKWRTPVMIGAGSVIAATGVGAGVGAALAGAGLVAGGAAAGAAAGATTGLISGAASGTVASGATAYAESEERAAMAEAEEYAATVERQNKAYELAAQIQSAGQAQVNPSSYYSVYSKWGRNRRYA